MKTKEPKTTVIFRKFKDGDIIALFPGEKWDNHSGLILSYMHVGQHGSADYNYIITTTLPAKENEYNSLYRELISLGYNLQINKKRTKR